MEIVCSLVVVEEPIYSVETFCSTQIFDSISRKRLLDLPSDWLVLPGHQYQLSDGTNPTFITVEQLLSDNEALNALDDDEAWNNLEFLSIR